MAGMTPTKSFRFSDHAELLRGDIPGFTQRKRTTTEQIYILVLAAIAVVIGVSLLVLNDAKTGSFICVIVGGVMLLVARQFEKQRTALQMSEFLNAIFASALSTGHLFSMVVKNSGEIVYFDRGFQTSFADFLEHPNRTIYTWLRAHGAPEEHRDKIEALLKNPTADKLAVPVLYGNAKTAQHLLLAVEPILRPGAFTLIRGKEV